MSCIGVLFAIESWQTEMLKKCKNDEELVEYIQEEIEEEWDEDWLCETDKAWDAIHRCFADGELDLFGGKPPLNAVIFGGEILNTQPDYYVSLKSNKLVKEIAKEIKDISKDDLRNLYYKISDSYQVDISEEDFEYTWEWFENVKDFYVKVAKSNRDVIFTVDQ
ncbi:MAG TPA: YfbM family protein [Acetivibrio sp.]|nr:YfbM family protein [Acetivibrio sp.]HPT91698.1 YfbM family protein [Acetivibrio sp.]